VEGEDQSEKEGASDGGIRREPALAEHEDLAPEPAVVLNEFECANHRDDAMATRNRRIADQMRASARQATLDPNDGIDL